jgi:hypothetical protein
MVGVGTHEETMDATSLPDAAATPVDPSIQLCHKIFQLNNPSLIANAAALGEEVKWTVTERGEHTAQHSGLGLYFWVDLRF